MAPNAKRAKMADSVEVIDHPISEADSDEIHEFKQAKPMPEVTGKYAKFSTQFGKEQENVSEGLDPSLTAYVNKMFTHDMEWITMHSRA